VKAATDNVNPIAGTAKTIVDDAATVLSSITAKTVGDEDAGAKLAQDNLKTTLAEDADTKVAEGNAKATLAEDADTKVAEGNATTTLAKDATNKVANADATTRELSNSALEQTTEMVNKDEHNPGDIIRTLEPEGPDIDEM
jgi:hypothetical protein